MIRWSPIRRSTKSYEPFWAQRIEEARDVGVEDPVDFACLDSIRERIQRIMLATPRPEPVAEPQELRLVDRREDRHHRCLDNLVLDGGDAERPLFAIRLWYVPPARRQCPVCAPMNSRVQISEVSVKVCRVVHPCHAIDTWSSALLQIEEGLPQDADRDVVQERCELLLLAPGDSSTYAILRL